MTGTSNGFSSSRDGEPASVLVSRAHFEVNSFEVSNFSSQTAVERKTVWSLDNPPLGLSTPFSRDWLLYTVSAAVRLFMGLVTLGLSVGLAIKTDVNLFDSPVYLSTYTDAIRITALVVGCCHALLSLCGGGITVWLLLSYYRQPLLKPNIFKTEIYSTRVQVLVGFFLSGTLLFPVCGINQMVCRPFWDDFSATGLDSLGEICSSASYHYALFAVCSISTIAGNFTIALWRVGRFFALHTIFAYIRFYSASLLNGISWHFFASIILYQKSAYFNQLDEDMKKQLVIFIYLLWGNGFFSAVFNFFGGIFSLLAIWWRSKIYIAFDFLVCFLLFWFVGMLCSSVVWTAKIKGYFCSFTDLEFKYEMAYHACSVRGPFIGMYFVMYLTAVIQIVVGVLCLVALSLESFKPREWNTTPQNDKKEKSFIVGRRNSQNRSE